MDDKRLNGFRIGDEKRTMRPGDIAVIPGGVEHEGYFPEDTEVIDFFAPAREDFLTSAPPPYTMRLERSGLRSPPFSRAGLA